MTHKSWPIFLSWCHTFEFTIYLRLHILGSKRKLPKRRNFNFDASNGFDRIYFQSHYIRILPVKIPRYSNGNIIDYDIYDFLQGEKTIKCIDKTHIVWVIVKMIWITWIFVLPHFSSVSKSKWKHFFAKNVDFRYLMN